MKIYSTDRAPTSEEGSSQAVSIAGMLYTSGQVAVDPTSGELVADGFETQVRQVLENLRQVLASAGCNFSDVLTTNVYLRDITTLPVLDQVFAEVVGDFRSARTVVQATELQSGARLMIDMVARLPEADVEPSKR